MCEKLLANTVIEKYEIELKSTAHLVMAVVRKAPIHGINHSPVRSRRLDGRLKAGP